MKSNNRLWRWLGLVCVLSFGALGYLGWQIHLQAPPIPKAVVTTDGDVLFTGEQIQLGQQAWRSAGGQQLGTVWGHGSYVAPDWTADTERQWRSARDCCAAHRDSCTALPRPFASICRLVVNDQRQSDCACECLVANAGRLGDDEPARSNCSRAAADVAAGSLPGRMRCRAPKPMNSATWRHS